MTEGLEEMIEEQADGHAITSLDDPRCPACDSDNYEIINRGMIICHNDDCRVYNFKPPASD